MWSFTPPPDRHNSHFAGNERHFVEAALGKSVQPRSVTPVQDYEGVYAERGVFVCFEGGEGSGKSTQSRLLQEWLQGEGYRTHLTFEPGDTQVGRTLRQIVLDPATGAVTRSFSGVRASLGDMVVTPDGRSLVAPEPDGSVGIWSLASGTVERRLQGHTMPVDAIAVSGDGSTVVTASQDGTVRAWPLPSV